jgi:DNA-binding protein HU-beta
VNRNELVDAVAGKADLSKSAANKAVDAVFDSITDALKGGTEVRLVGFGTFSVASRVEASQVQSRQTAARRTQLRACGPRSRPCAHPPHPSAQCPRRLGGVSGSGRLAQLVEHLVYTEGVGGSSPSSPTNPWHSLPADPSKITMEGRTGRTARASFGGLPASFREISRLDRSNATGELLDTPGAPS